MPEPRSGENHNDYISRCVPVVIEEGHSQDEAVAMCESYWEQAHKNDKEIFKDIIFKEAGNESSDKT